jgi:septum formation protein
MATINGACPLSASAKTTPDDTIIPMRLVLASASPRRAELLRTAGFDFEIAPADVNETQLTGEEPEAYAVRIANKKAATIAIERQSGFVVLAADTVVVARGRIMGKPVSRGDAELMLKTLSGTVHEVHTGVVLHAHKREFSQIVTTRVRLLSLADDEIAWYIETGEPYGKAGAYAIQGLASRFVDWIEGSWSNVVGLPIATVYRMLKELRAQS